MVEFPSPVKILLKCVVPVWRSRESRISENCNIP